MISNIQLKPTWRAALHDYDYTRTLTKSDWAWEYLRRNHAFRATARMQRNKGFIRVRLETGPILTRLRARLPYAEAWGLCCFPDPNLTATQTCPVWLPQTTSILCAATTIALRPTDTDGFHFSKLPHVAHILLDTVGRQHLILRIGGGTYQLSISDAPGIIAPVALSLRLHNLRDIAAAVRQLGTLANVLASSTRSNGLPARWSTQNRRWRNALIALDGRRAGATFREIAAISYGRERVERDWPYAGLKVRVRRDLARGLDLCNGGYRALLDKG